MLKDALGNYRGTLSDVNRIILRNQDNALAWYDRGNLKHSAGDDEGAIDDYTEALRIGLRKREELHALGNRAMALATLGRYEEAIMDCTSIIDALPKNKSLLRTAHLRRAELNKRTGNAQAARLDSQAAEQLTLR
ncbi:tetratricopeptide repeat protein [Prosthecochloris sp. ZM]|uniref:TPR repeat-containing protein n=1 Tax=Prosthecochloris aestuarii (strain DSM 271 / SK 413) TaxID=290512 RepID=B4S7X1_PROA2|nr:MULTISPECIES: tetratricopeptide repeat protein [Prosthecochloris]ACF46158.1 TPR repeat-containing protein [Prosthecochloris aestuarii DSM 271]RDD30307.1 tetratricopeptide repeat protein [Prosthecochloris sp. ZM]